MATSFATSSSKSARSCLFRISSQNRRTTALFSSVDMFASLSLRRPCARAPPAMGVAVGAASGLSGDLEDLDRPGTGCARDLAGLRPQRPDHRLAGADVLLALPERDGDGLSGLSVDEDVDTLEAGLGLEHRERLLPHPAEARFGLVRRGLERGDACVHALFLSLVARPVSSGSWRRCAVSPPG